MATIDEIPVTVTPEAVAFIDGLGLRREFERMMEHTLRTVAGLRSIEVDLQDIPDTGMDPTIIITPLREERGPDYDPTDLDWRHWQFEHFPTDVCLRFALLSEYAPDGR